MQSCMAPPGNNAFAENPHEWSTNCSSSVLLPVKEIVKPKLYSFLVVPHQQLLNDPPNNSFQFFPSSLSLSFSLTLFPRLCPEDLNSSVLAYMTETLGYSLSEIIHTLTTNRPSAIMASYHLLLNKLSRSQKGAKASKVHTSFSSTHS